MNITDEVVYYEKPFAIVKCTRLFGVGFNVYKETSGDEQTMNLTKINNRMSYFSSEEAAMKFLIEQKNARI